MIKFIIKTGPGKDDESLKKQFVNGGEGYEIQEHTDGNDVGNSEKASSSS